MSMWYEPKGEDISYSEDGKELHTYLFSDDFGAVYVSFEIEDLKEWIKSAPKKNKKESKRSARSKWIYVIVQNMELIMLIPIMGKEGTTGISMKSD